MSESDFLTFLVDETLKLQKSGKKLSSFDLKLKDYGLNYLRGEYVPKLQVIRFRSDRGSLDFPINWSVFDTKKITGYLVLSQFDDQDHIFSVMKSIWGNAVEKILILEQEGHCYIVALKSGEDAHMRDLLKKEKALKSA